MLQPPLVWRPPAWCFLFNEDFENSKGVRITDRYLSGAFAFSCSSDSPLIRGVDETVPSTQKPTYHKFWFPTEEVRN